MDPYVLAVIGVTVLIVVWLLVRASKSAKDGFGKAEPKRKASPKAKRIAAQAADVFENSMGGKASYRHYRSLVEDADPVQFTKAKKLHREGRLTPEEVEIFV